MPFSVSTPVNSRFSLQNGTSRRGGEWCRSRAGSIPNGFSFVLVATFPTSFPLSCSVLDAGVRRGLDCLLLAQEHHGRAHALDERVGGQDPVVDAEAPCRGADRLSDLSGLNSRVG